MDGISPVRPVRLAGPRVVLVALLVAGALALVLAACAGKTGTSSHHHISASHAATQVTSNPLYPEGQSVVRSCIKAGHTSVTTLYACVIANFPGALSTADQKCQLGVFRKYHKVLPVVVRHTDEANGAGKCVVTNK